MTFRSVQTVLVLCLVWSLSRRLGATGTGWYDIQQKGSLKLEKQSKEPVDTGGFKAAVVPEDLTVLAVVHSHRRRLIQLVLSWKIPSKGRQPDSFNIHVVPASSNHSECLTEPYYTFVADGSARTWRVPEVVVGSLPHDSLLVLPDCTYSVQLQANPHDGKAAITSLYTVPECVGSVCSCRQAALLARSRVRVSVLLDDTVNITWLPLSPPPPLARFVVGVGKEVMRSASGQAVFNTSWVREVGVSPGSRLYQVTHVVTGPGRYIATVLLADQRHCLGPPGNHTFTIPAENQFAVTGFTKREVVWMTVLPSASAVVALCVVVAKSWKRCCAWSRRRLPVSGGSLRCIRPHPPPAPWTGVYKAISVDSSRCGRFNFIHSLQERNVLYVEKEIEEAKRSGDADNYEVSYDRLALGRQVGKGAFGRVFLAKAQAIQGVPGDMVVAVKKLKHKATADEVEEFLAEIAMMKSVGRHPHIVTLVACCTLKHPLCMVMEYVPCGDLLAYLRQLRDQRSDLRYSEESSSSYITPIATPSCASSQPSATTGCSNMSSDVMTEAGLEHKLDPRLLHNFASQIARGMAYLEAKQITHRDLAARNILIDEKKTLKISDFGLSRSGIYVNTKRRKVPLRWLSIEAMRDSLYSSKSDVWAFGVVLWEIGTLGGFPYPTISDYELLQFLVLGKRLDQPDNFSDELYTLMEICWSPSVDKRPTFKDILQQLDSTPRTNVYVDFRADHQFPPTQQFEAELSAKTPV